MLDSAEPVGAYEVSGKARGCVPVLSRRQAGVLRQLASVLVPSRYNVSVDLPDGRKAVYNTFSAAITVLQPKLWQRYLTPGSRHPVSGDSLPAMIGKLFARGFFVVNGVDEKELVRQYYQRARHHADSGLKSPTVPR